MQREATVYIACSIDGYIAGPDGDMSFLSQAEWPGEDYGYAAFMQEVDTILMGRVTYEWLMTQVPEYPHAGIESYILGRTDKPDTGSLHFHSGSAVDLLCELKNKSGKTIFIDGGAKLVQSLIREDLIDRMIISVIPVILGGGTHLFGETGKLTRFRTVSVKQFESGLIQTEYRRI